MKINSTFGDVCSSAPRRDLNDPQLKVQVPLDVAGKGSCPTPDLRLTRRSLWFDQKFKFKTELFFCFVSMTGNTVVSSVLRRSKKAASSAGKCKLDLVIALLTLEIKFPLACSKAFLHFFPSPSTRQFHVVKIFIFAGTAAQVEPFTKWDPNKRTETNHSE